MAEKSEEGEVGKFCKKHRNWICYQKVNEEFAMLMTKVMTLNAIKIWVQWTNRETFRTGKNIANNQIIELNKIKVMKKKRVE